MERRRAGLRLALALVLLGACLAPAASALGERFSVRVFLDRAQPARFVRVDDFRINETVYDQGGVRDLTVQGPEGAFKVPFKDISHIDFTRFLGYVDGDTACYQARVTCFYPDTVRAGVVGLRVLLGTSAGQRWTLRPRNLPDRGEGLFRIAFREWSDGDPPPIREEEARPFAPRPPGAPEPSYRVTTPPN